MMIGGSGAYRGLSDVQVRSAAASSSSALELAVAPPVRRVRREGDGAEVAEGSVGGGVLEPVVAWWRGASLVERGAAVAVGVAAVWGLWRTVR